jgi:hypothetical protein
MKTFVPALVLCLCAALSTNAPRAAVQAAAAVNECGPVGAPSMRTTLYFGLNRKTGNVSETQWKRFLRDHVTPRFPQGLTVWEANGQWRRADGVIVQEPAKVLLLVHDQTPAVHAAIDAIIEDYKKTFEQESVLWETARVCATF